MLLLFASLFSLVLANLNTENENFCQLQFDNKPKQNDQFDAYAGNAFSYDLACSVLDSRMRSGDKYYVIDLVLYGPNSRVAKAWREQFTTLSLFKSRNLSLNKKIAFNWVGTNTIVCSVSKYNNVQNKFTKICQRSILINATENAKMSTLSTRQYQTTKSNLNILNLKQIWSFRKNESFILEDFNKTAMRVNLSDKAMQFRNVYKVKLEEDKKFITTESKDTIRESPKADKSTQTKSLNILQPLSIILVFLVIFAISIGTIIYLTYNQHDYKNVKVNDPEAETVESNNQSNEIAQQV